MKPAKTTASTPSSPILEAEKVIVLGGGIAGLAAADYLSRQGAHVTLLEASERLGGMHKSKAIGLYRFDYGSIFYESNARLLMMAPGITTQMPQVRRVNRRLRPDGSLSRYPFDMSELVRGPKVQLLRMGLSLLVARMVPGSKGTLAAASTARLGQVFLRESGLRNYMVHFNGAPPEEIDRTFFDDRMRFVANRTQLREVLRMMLRWRTDKTADRPLLFVRPAKGYAPIFDCVARCLTERGVALHTGLPVDAIEGSPGALQVRCGEQVFTAPRIVGAMPLDALHRLVFGSASGLRSLDLLSLYVSADWLNPKCGNVLYNFHANGGWKRLTVYSRLHPDPEVSRAYFTVEVTLTADSTIDSEVAFASFAAHVEAMGIARGLRLEGSDRHPGAYPFYALGYAKQADAVRARLKAAGITLVGRQGRFEYLPTSSGVIRRTEEALRNS